MRESTGSTFIFGLVIAFTLIFAGFLVLALSYSKAFKLKNEVTSMIEKYEGITIKDKRYNMGSVEIINNYLTASGYRTKGHCEEGEFGSLSLEDHTLVETIQDEEYYYCIKIKTNNDTCKSLFTVTIFYDFNLPVFGQLREYSIAGQTNEIYFAWNDFGSKKGKSCIKYN